MVFTLEPDLWQTRWPWRLRSGPGFIQASTRTWSLTCGATRIRVIEISSAKAGVREFAGHTGLRKAAVTPCSHVK